MRVVHLSTRDTQGGAAGSAYRLHNGLLEAGVHSRMYVRSKHSDDSTVLEHDVRNGFMDRIRRRLHREKMQFDFRRYRETRPDGLEPFRDDRTSYWLHDVSALNPDIINLHWVANFVDYRHFFQECVGSTPVVWRLSDLNPFTGGCHYDQGCGKYRSVCGACPQLGSTNPSDLSRAIWNRKKEAFDVLGSNQLHFVAQSEWIKDQVKASPLTGRFPATVIPNGLDTDLFRPRDTTGLRNALGIPQEDRVVLFVADYETPRKGFDLLVDALEKLRVEDVTLLSVGSSQPGMDTALPHLHLGRIESDPLLSAFYSFADVFIIPSRQDNLPNTVLESMASGTPVVGFNTGGIPDMVRPGETGWLAETGDVQALRESIKTALSDEEARKRMGKHCREVAKDEYALEVQARRYRQLYQHLVD